MKSAQAQPLSTKTRFLSSQNDKCLGILPAAVEKWIFLKFHSKPGIQDVKWGKPHLLKGTTRGFLVQEVEARGEGMQWDQRKQAVSFPIWALYFPPPGWGESPGPV